MSDETPAPESHGPHIPLNLRDLPILKTILLGYSLSLRRSQAPKPGYHPPGALNLSVELALTENLAQRIEAALAPEMSSLPEIHLPLIYEEILVLERALRHCIKLIQREVPACKERDGFLEEARTLRQKFERLLLASHLN